MNDSELINHGTPSATRVLPTGLATAALKFCATTAVVLCILSAVGSQACSQARFGQIPPRDRFERLQQLKKLRLMEVLGLAEEESVRFFARYNKFENELRDLESQRNGVIDDLEAALKRGEKAEVYQRGFDQLEALGKKVADARLQFYEDAKKLLTAEQVAKLIVFERNFNRDLREMIQEVQRERRRGFAPR